jgi:hypothetical protein
MMHGLCELAVLLQLISKLLCSGQRCTAVDSATAWSQLDEQNTSLVQNFPELSSAFNTVAGLLIGV